MKTTFMAGIIIGVMLVVAGCGSNNAAQLEIGRQIYNTGGASSVPCVTCHTLDGSTLVGPSFKGLKDRAGSRVPGMSAEDYIRQSIVDPSAFIVDGFQNQMYKEYAKTLTDEQINGLVAFLMAQ